MGQFSDNDSYKQYTVIYRKPNIVCQNQKHFHNLLQKHFIFFKYLIEKIKFRIILKVQSIDI